MTNPPNWMRHGACIDHPDPDMWFPTQGAAGAKRLKQAIAICEECPVKGNCFDHAMSLEFQAPRRERYGVWGASTPEERFQTARRRPRFCPRCASSYLFDAANPNARICPACRARQDAVQPATCHGCGRKFSGIGPYGKPVGECQRCRNLARSA